VKQGAPTIQQLQDTLRGLDGKGYKAYKQVMGRYEGSGLELRVDHAQGDPFADPTRIRIKASPATARLPAWSHSTPDRRRATADFINRALVREALRHSRPSGSGASGQIRVLRPGQEVLSRTSVVVSADGSVEARFRIGLPARGRTILGEEAAELVRRTVQAARSSLICDVRAETDLRRHVETVEDSVALRAQLPARGLVAFVADGAVLPRRSGVDDAPLDARAAIPFQAPRGLRVTLDAPNTGPVHGMGIPRGITLVVGGGYHGKSTLLRALERGVYDHLPGDGREQVVTVPGAAKVRAEDGRRVAGADISNFISGLPDGSDTERFHTEYASGSTSQAAAIVEALEVGADLLLIDEDTSATNFMIRDARMQRVVQSSDEPITPFIDHARSLFEKAGVSSVLVVGGSGDYFDVAHRVIAMRSYRPADVSDLARRVAAELPSGRSGAQGDWRPIRARRLDPDSIDPSTSRRDTHIRILSRDRVQYGRYRVDLGAVEQIVEMAQTRAIAHALATAREDLLTGEHTVTGAVAAILAHIQEQGLGSVHPQPIGELAAFRGIELAAFLHRLRSAETLPDVTHASDGAVRAGGSAAG
jgi:predicted ABC-class ATPase